jgi:two-component sensor histidine kinase
MRRYFHWKSYLALVAVGIVLATLLYTNQLAARLAAEERKDVEQWAEAIKMLASSSSDQDLTFASYYVAQNSTIPVIQADEKGRVISSKNIDTTRAKDPHGLLHSRLADFKDQHKPIVVDYGIGKNYVYYGESYLLQQLRYFPYVQLLVIFLFLTVVLVALSAAHRSLQNQVWVGLSKETAHQLGTPLSSMEGWIELLSYQDGNNEAVTEMRKDLERLKLVADRFSKVGSAPQLVEEDMVERLQGMVAYMQKRAPAKVEISLNAPGEAVPVMINGPLFDWVVENLMRNALDAMGGKGKLHLKLQDLHHQVIVDVTDTGKGIPSHQIKKVFNPGFTTKKRGWGLGLSLAQRIVRQYHNGSLSVKSSEVGKGTTFRIVLRR